MIDWSEVAAATVSSVLASTVVSAWVGSHVFRIRFERFQSMDKEREKHWNKWREDLEPRFAEAGATRDKETVAWRAAVEVRFGVLDERLRAHELECRSNWSKLMNEHGQITAKLDMLLDGRRKR